jgi:hypothetical protein
VLADDRRADILNWSTPLQQHRQRFPICLRFLVFLDHTLHLLVYRDLFADEMTAPSQSGLSKEDIQQASTVDALGSKSIPDPELDRAMAKSATVRSFLSPNSLIDSNTRNHDGKENFKSAMAERRVDAGEAAQREKLVEGKASNARPRAERVHCSKHSLGKGEF